MKIIGVKERPLLPFGWLDPIAEEGEVRVFLGSGTRMEPYEWDQIQEVISLFEISHEVSVMAAPSKNDLNSLSKSPIYVFYYNTTDPRIAPIKQILEDQLPKKQECKFQEQSDSLKAFLLETKALVFLLDCIWNMLEYRVRKDYQNYTDQPTPATLAEFEATCVLMYLSVFEPKRARKALEFRIIAILERNQSPTTSINNLLRLSATSWGLATSYEKWMEKIPIIQRTLMYMPANLRVQSRLWQPQMPSFTFEKVYPSGNKPELKTGEVIYLRLGSNLLQTSKAN